MPTVSKIKIIDDIELRNKLDALFEQATQKQVAQWALALAHHILELSAPQYLKNQIITEGFSINKEWQNGTAKMHDVRQAGFKIHKLAKDCKNDLIQIALRVVGHAVSTGHMKEHGMVASDYAIKYINMSSDYDNLQIIKERTWQIDRLNTNFNSTPYAKNITYPCTNI